MQLVHYATRALCNPWIMQHMHYATRASCNMCNNHHICIMQLVHYATCALCNMCIMQHVHYTTRALCNTCIMHHMHYAAHELCNTCIIQFAICATCIMQTARFPHLQSPLCKEGPTLWVGWSLTIGVKGGECSVIPSVHGKGLSFLGRGHWGHGRLYPISRAYIACFLQLVTYHPGVSHPPTQGWSPKRRMYTTDLDLTKKNKTRWQLPGMVTFNP